MFVAHLVSYKVRKLNMSWFSGKFFSSRFFRNFNRIAPSRRPGPNYFPASIGVDLKRVVSRKVVLQNPYGLLVIVV